MKMWVIYQTSIRKYFNIVFTTKELADAYKAKYGNDTWHVEFTTVIDHVAMI